MLINPITDPLTPKEKVIEYVRGEISRLQFPIVEEFMNKPWGFMFRFSEEIIPRFVELFFKEDDIKITEGLLMSPKILIIAPHSRLSWQYHNRRADIWKVIGGEVAMSLSKTDEKTSPHTYHLGELINIPQGMRHQNGKVNCWGYIAEIWQHTDPDNPSDEEDIVRLSDDYYREGTTKPV